MVFMSVQTDFVTSVHLVYIVHHTCYMYSRFDQLTNRHAFPIILLQTLTPPSSPLPSPSGQPGKQTTDCHTQYM